MEQIGGGACSLCGSPGTNKTTCPWNPDPKVKHNPAKHPNAIGAKPVAVKAVKEVKEVKAVKVAKPVKAVKAVKDVKVEASPELTVERFLNRANKDLMDDIGYPASWNPYILHFTDGELDEFASAIIELAKKQGPVLQETSLLDIATYITHCGAGSDMSSPEIQGLKQKMLARMGNKAFKRDENDNLYMISKEDIIIRMIKDFAIHCFTQFRSRNPTVWRFGKVCETLSIIPLIEKNKDAAKIVSSLPAHIVRDSHHYIFNILFTRESIEELDTINANGDDSQFFKTFEFRRLSKEDEAFVSKFIGDMVDFVNSSYSMEEDVQFYADEYGIRQNLNIILHTMMVLQQINTPKAKKLHAYLMKFCEKNAPLLSCLMAYAIYKVAVYVDEKHKSN